MELTYTSNEMVELGDIKDFEFDLAYGKDENDFEITTPENEMKEGYYWFVKNTNYGGVVDEIEGTSSINEVTYRGRSFQGILASYSSWQLKNNEVMTINDDTIDLYGSPYDITIGIINQLGIDIQVEEYLDQPIINETVDRSLNIYQLMRYAFEKNGYKINLYWDDGIVLDVTGAIDYTSNMYFDVSRFAVKIDKKNVPNHLVGVFKRDEETNIIKHLYADEKGIIQPYYLLDTNHDIPVHDYEYERIEGEPVITGLNERVEVIEGGSNIENYDVVTQLTETNGNTPFENGIPADWNEKCYTDYYYQEIENDEVKYKNFEVELENYGFVVDADVAGEERKTLAWFQENWMTCFKGDGQGNLTQLQVSDCPVVPHYEEIYWNATTFPYFRGNYYNYYYRVSEGVYNQIEGKTVYKPIWQHSVGTYWNTNRGEFYFNWARRKWLVDFYGANGKFISKTWVYESAQDGTPTVSSYNLVSGHSLLSYKQFNGGNITSKTTIWKTKDGKRKANAQKFIIHPPKTVGWTYEISLESYCNITGRKLASITFEDNKYWLRESYEVAPDTLPQPIFSKQDIVQGYPAIRDENDDPIIYYYQEDKEKPAYKQGEVYRKVNDHYTNLVQAMLDKYNELIAQSSVIEPQVDTDIGEFDVGDIIGSTHPFTNEQLTAKLTKKIVKGNPFKTEVSYEIG